MADYILDDAGVLMKTIRTTRDDYAKKACCLICLKMVAPGDRKSHKQSVAHKLLVNCLKKDIYPFSCVKCPMRFSTTDELLHHTLGHSTKVAIYESPACCYLCRLPFKNQEELRQHSHTSVGHFCRRQMISEMVFRDTIVHLMSENDLKTGIVSESSFQESILSSRSDVSTVKDPKPCVQLCSPANHMRDMHHSEMFVDALQNNSSQPPLLQEDLKANLLCSTNPSVPAVDPWTVCSLCSVNVPLGLMSQHISGRKHRNKMLTYVQGKNSNSIDSGPSCSSNVLDVSFGTNNVPKPTLEKSTKCADNLKTNLSSGATLKRSISLHTYYCSVCDVVVARGSVGKHLKEPNHTKTLKALRAEGPKGNCDVNNTLVSDLTRIRKVPSLKERSELEIEPVASDSGNMTHQSPKTNLLCSNDAPSKKTLSSQFYCSICSVNVPKSNVADHNRGKTHTKNEKALKKSNAVHESAHSDHNESEVIKTCPEMLVTDNTFKIGDSTFTCLQAEFDEVKNSVGKDLNDYEVECETCGGVFQTFNNNLDLSYDLHVQNDPQHALALAVPLERNAKQMAELSTTGTAPEKAEKPSKRARKKAKKKARKRCSAKSDAAPIEVAVAVPLTTQENNATIQTGETPEEQPVYPNSLPFICILCNVSMSCGDKNDHLAGKKHKKHMNKWHAQEMPR